MGRARARWRALAASLLGHAGLVAVVAAVGWLAGPAARPGPAVVPVRRVPDPEASRPGLVVETGPAGAAASPADTDTVVSLDSADPRFRPYLTAVKRRIWERWGEPALEPGQPKRGTLVVEFTLTRSGRLAGSGVLEPSGTPALDRAALDAVARAVPFTPLPESIVGDSLRIRARFTYD